MQHNDYVKRVTFSL